MFYECKESGRTHAKFACNAIDYTLPESQKARMQNTEK